MSQCWKGKFSYQLVEFPFNPLIILINNNNNSEITPIYSENQRALQNTIEFIGLEKDIFKKVSTYSLGMKSRLSLGIALINNPDLIILDEPTNGLDPKGIIELRNKLLSLKKNRKAIIISSHLLSEIEKICDEIYFVKDGMIIEKVIVKSQKDNLEDIYNRVEKEYYEEKYLC